MLVFNLDKEINFKDFLDFFGFKGMIDNFFIMYIVFSVDISKSFWWFEKNIGVSELVFRMFE